MKKAAVIYWSGTGNTEAMANAVAEGMISAGAEVSLLSADAVSAADLAGLDAVALGCPAMGSEVLEEDVFEPMFSSCKKQFVGKSAALFGSYGWGDGEWMRTWEQDCRGFEPRGKRSAAAGGRRRQNGFSAAAAFAASTRA